MFHFGDKLTIHDFDTEILAFKGYETLEITAPEIVLSGTIEFESGYTINIEPGGKLKDCDIEDFLDQ